MRRTLALLVLLAACAEDSGEPLPPAEPAAPAAILLPPADLGRPLPPGARRNALMLRVGREGPRSAIRVPTGEEIAIPDRHARQTLLRREAERAGRLDGPIACSRLHVVLRVDARASWRRFVRLYRDCTAPGVRIDRIWLAVRRADDEEAVLPCFPPVEGRDRQRLAPHGEMDEVDLRIVAPGDPAGFRDPERLRAWLHHFRENPRPGTEPWFTLVPDPAVPLRPVVDVLNEARRFGVRIALTDPGPLIGDAPVSRRFAFVAGGPAAWSEPDPSLPPIRPGRALTANPDATARFVAGRWETLPEGHGRLLIRTPRGKRVPGEEELR